MRSRRHIDSVYTVSVLITCTGSVTIYGKGGVDMKREIVLLGNPALYEVSVPVQKEEIPKLLPVVNDLHDTLMAYRAQHHAGRAVAAPQIGVQKRLIYFHVDKPIVFLNPSLVFPDDEMMAVMDDCMSFPHLLVKVLRHKRCTIQYHDLDWKACSLDLDGDLSELLQHEYDHLDGILATMRAIDDKSFYYQK